ncbi:hypothetical protein ACFVG1_36075 [Streptomyces bacillaris]|uniref:hypothetical protein n=1 Tax=Streptomyces bacillaris TaxID=68179 RepID=UPI0035E065F0
MTGPDSPYGLASAPAGTLYIADFGNDRVVELPVRGVSGACPSRACTPRPDRPYHRRGATPAQGGY